MMKNVGYIKKKTTMDLDYIKDSLNKNFKLRSGYPVFFGDLEDLRIYNDKFRVTMKFAPYGRQISASISNTSAVLKEMIKKNHTTTDVKLKAYTILKKQGRQYTIEVFFNKGYVKNMEEFGLKNVIKNVKAKQV